MDWKIKALKGIKQTENMVMVEGLPGVGNVGKIAIDFIIDDLGAEKIFDVQSPKFPHCVFVNEKNLVELPTIEIYQKKLKDKVLFLVAGDIQPIDETSCYEFCNELLDLCKKNNCKEIITLGGVGTSEIPKNPKLYCTGNNQKIIKKYYNLDGISNNIYGTVGPIMGVSGLLVGLAKKKNIPAVTLMAETYGHPGHLGIKEAKEILKLLDKKLKLGLNFKRLNKEIKSIEEDLKMRLDLNKFVKEKTKQTATPDKKYIDYIG